MTLPAPDGYARLTEREKQTLRLIVRGHDAKSTARHLGLSVHTINERLRDARRKLAVSSSREAARLLLDREARDPDSGGDERIGDAMTPDALPSSATPHDGGRRRSRRAGLTIGVVTMILALGLFVSTLQPQPALAPPGAASVAAAPSGAIDAATDPVAEAARDFLALLDQARWEDSWRATGTAFRSLNTLRTWAAVSEKVRAPFGAAISRTLISHENLPAPPSGYEVIKFRTRFPNRADTIETVSLDREDGIWRVVGVTIG